MKRSIFYTTWYTLAMAGVTYIAAIFMTLQKTKPLQVAALVVLTLLQLTGFIYFLRHDPKKPESRMLKCFLRLLQLSSIGVIFCLFLSIYGLSIQYHNDVPPTANDVELTNITVVENDELYIMYPQYKTVDFVTENMPSRNDTDITFCCAATYQLRYNPFFSPDEISGVYVQKGKLYRGYELSQLGAFSFYDGTFHFANVDDAEESLKIAAEKGGDGFQSFLLIYDYQTAYRPMIRYRCFRAIAELDGKLCIIDSKKQIHLDDFTATLQALGVKHAISLDMGNWSYSWYRDNAGKANTLIGLPWPFQHNWLAFHK